jgi:hypothetical protein
MLDDGRIRIRIREAPSLTDPNTASLALICSTLQVFPSLSSSFLCSKSLSACLRPIVYRILYCALSDLTFTLVHSSLTRCQ